jgi:hypothetical protein
VTANGFVVAFKQVEGKLQPFFKAATSLHFISLTLHLEMSFPSSMHLHLRRRDGWLWCWQASRVGVE